MLPEGRSRSGSRLSVSAPEGIGGTLTLSGDAVQVDGSSQLLATGPDGGGTIQVGGSWQNSDPSVRQATTTQIEPGALIDASSTGEGDGGEIVVWSDIQSADSVTDVGGTLRAMAGPRGGDGGRIETSGAGVELDGVAGACECNRRDLGTVASRSL